MTGISWLMADHAESATESPIAIRDHKVLASLSRYMILGVAAAVSLLLTMTSLDYLSIMYGSKVPKTLSVATWAVPVLVLLLATMLTAGRRFLRKWWRDISSTPAATGPFTFATFALLTYGIAGPVAAGWMMARSGSAWEGPDQSTAIAVSLAVGLMLPGLLIVSVVIATPEIVPPLEQQPGQPSGRLTPDPTLPHVGVVKRRTRRVLQPLDHETLLQRSIEIFPQGYLTNISIIQGVALSVLTVETVNHLKQVGIESAPQTVPLSLFSLAGLIIVSYEYLWFSTVMRWSPTFRDTAIPVILGVAEIVPPLLLGRTVAWWIAAAFFALLGSVAFLNTVSRLRPEMFPQHSEPYLLIRRLLSHLSIICTCMSTFATIIAILLAQNVRHSAAISSVGACIIALPGAAMIIGYSETVLNNVYSAYSIDRRPPVFSRMRGVILGDADNFPSTEGPSSGQKDLSSPPGTADASEEDPQAPRMD
ncbi:hypothetical protein [Kribbella jejuensis]|uniref:Uncharacterized protein n=1 Tax=Kribbella jejuensis TaxID=236068 RepID=A0A542EWJ4_9ACTN|nr:hypothetical protein [Kribbella jejuensis]TQJ19730.1 hypothetical protein FB475_3906 [Kribbella jejuensis]